MMKMWRALALAAMPSCLLLAMPTGAIAGKPTTDHPNSSCKSGKKPTCDNYGGLTALQYGADDGYDDDDEPWGYEDRPWGDHPERKCHRERRYCDRD